jgi:hypothetical protein
MLITSCQTIWHNTAEDSNLKHSLQLKETSQHKHTPLNDDIKIIQQ